MKKPHFLPVALLVCATPALAETGSEKTQALNSFWIFALQFLGIMAIIYALVLVTGAIGKAYRKKYGDTGLGAAPPDRSAEMIENMKKYEKKPDNKTAAKEDESK